MTAVHASAEMTQVAFERGDWQVVIDAHRLESLDVAEWLRYGSTLLHTIQGGSEAGKQQQQAALANLRQTMELAGIPVPAEPDPPAPLRWVLLVLGMHRSGTSALAGLLCQQGFQAPLEADGGDAHNPTGYWEPRQLRAYWC